MIAVNRYKASAIVAYIFLCLLQNIVLRIFDDEYAYRTWLNLIGIFALFNIVLVLYYQQKMSGLCINIASIFIFLSYLFHFGQVFLLMIKPDYNTYIVISEYSSENVEGLMYSLNIILLISFFSIVFTKNGKKYKGCLIRIKEMQPIEMRKAGRLIIIFTLPLFFYRIFISVNNTRIYGSYSAAYGVTVDLFSGVYGAIVSWLAIGFIFSLWACNNKKQSRRLYIFAMVVYMLSMLSGERMQATISICVISYCYFRDNDYKCKTHDISFKNFLKLMSMCLLLIVLLNTIVNVRDNGISLMSVTGYIFGGGTDFVINALAEFGGSIITVTAACREIPVNIPFNLGLSYLESLCLIGVNIGGLFNGILDNIAFTRSFVVRFSYGGSYIGELFYNFGQFGYLVAPMVGYIIGKLSVNMETLVRNKNYTKASYYIMVMYSLMSWVRGYANSLTRGIVWGAIMIFIVSNIIFSMKKGTYFERNTNFGSYGGIQYK